MRKKSTVEQFDAYFELKPDTERYATFVLIVGVVVVLPIYMYLIPYTESFLADSKAQLEATQKQLTEVKGYLAEVTVGDDREYMIKKHKKELKKIKNTISTHKYNNSYIDFQIHALSGLLYNEKNWANFLNSISEKATSNKIEIGFIKNQAIKSQNTKNFGHVLEVEINCSGNFQNTLSFINNLEKSKLLVDVYEMNITKQGYDIESLLKVSVWGIDY